MTDRTFIYDEALFRRCVESSLVLTVDSSNSYDDDNDDNDRTSTWWRNRHCHSFNPGVHNGNSNNSDPKKVVETRNTYVMDKYSSCSQLFELYVEHYQLHHLFGDETIPDTTDLMDTTTPMIDDNGINQELHSHHTMNDRRSCSMNQFIQNIHWIDQYNNNNDTNMFHKNQHMNYDGASSVSQQQRYHRLAINRFTYQNLQTILPSNHDDQMVDDDVDNDQPHAHHHSPRLLQQQQKTLRPPAVVHHLTSYDDIRRIGRELYSATNIITDRNNNNNMGNNNNREVGFMKLLTKYTKHEPTTKSIKFELYPKKLRLPTNNMIPTTTSYASTTSSYNLTYSAESPLVGSNNDDDDRQNSNSNADGSLRIIGRNKKSGYNNNPQIDTRTDESTSNNDDDIFSTHINWATNNNPDGVSIVHDPIDQGNCGSCWALAATGSIEANAARRQGYLAYQQYLTDNPLPSNNDGDNNGSARNTYEIYRNATLLAQRIEEESMDRLHLSIQELIDCDIAVSKGCVGGNPLLAFYFVHKYGLTTSDNYPYVGEPNKCHKNKVNQPIATVSSWGIIPPNSERHMELVLRYIGPIAVGFNGADPTFLSYSGGIYSNNKCHHKSNHALLVVGYGEEDIVDDVTGNVDIVPYWIARNSWGQGWGENGYVRIRRSKGGKGERGQCGIARSPSVALGGILLDPPNDVTDPTTITMDSTNYQDNNYNSGLRGSDSTNDDIEAVDSPYEQKVVVPHTITERFCLRLRQPLDHASHCSRMADYISSNRALVLGVVGILATLVLAVWPLTWDCRRRRANRQRKRQLQQQQQQLLEEGENGGGENKTNAFASVTTTDTAAATTTISVACSNDETTPLIPSLRSNDTNNITVQYGGTQNC